MYYQNVESATLKQCVLITLLLFYFEILFRFSKKNIACGYCNKKDSERAKVQHWPK